MNWRGKVSIHITARSGQALVFLPLGCFILVSFSFYALPLRYVHAAKEEADTRTVINHNPLPDITHEDFVSILGPLLAPENYPQLSPTQSPTLPSNHSNTSLNTVHSLPFLFNPNSPAPFDWLHFEGRSVKTTLNNITGLDGLARERKWRRYCVFSVDLSRKGRQGVEAV